MKLLAAILLVAVAGGGYAYYANSTAKAVGVTPASTGACCAHDLKPVAAETCSTECAEACDVTACAPSDCAPAECGEVAGGAYAMVGGNALASATGCSAEKAACAEKKSECAEKAACGETKSECATQTACTAGLD